MKQSLDVLIVALRVLTAINQKCQPDDADIRKLEAFTGPRPEGMNLDEFACDTIRKAIAHRSEVQAAKDAVAARRLRRAAQ